MRFTRALSLTNILSRSQRALGAQTYILEKYELVLRGPKVFLVRSEKALIAIKRFLGDLKGSWELSKIGRLNEPGGWLQETLRSEEPWDEQLFLDCLKGP